MSKNGKPVKCGKNVEHNKSVNNIVKDVTDKSVKNVKIGTIENDITNEAAKNV